MKKSQSSGCVSCLMFLGTVVLVVGIWVVTSVQEASTFNKLTGSNVTWWDAMWVNLRVQDSSIKNNSQQ